MTARLEGTAITRSTTKTGTRRQLVERRIAPFSLRCGALLIDYIVLAAILASMMGAGIGWLVGGATHAAAVVFLQTNGTRISKDLDALGTGSEFEARGKGLLKRQALHFSILSLAGLIAQGLFILKP